MKDILSFTIVFTIDTECKMHLRKVIPLIQIKTCSWICTRTLCKDKPNILKIFPFQLISRFIPIIHNFVRRGQKALSEEIAPKSTKVLYLRRKIKMGDCPNIY